MWKVPEMLGHQMLNYLRPVGEFVSTKQANVNQGPRGSGRLAASVELSQEGRKRRSTEQFWWWNVRSPDWVASMDLTKSDELGDFPQQAI
jgi:hypothetical protein